MHNFPHYANHQIVCISVWQLDEKLVYIFAHSVGLMIIGNSTLTAGDAAVLKCETDVNVDAIRWISNDVIAAESSSNEVYLNFNPVFDYLHGKEYICQTTAAYGIAEKRITISVQGM